jgi:hypothetical protein
MSLYETRSVTLKRYQWGGLVRLLQASDWYPEDLITELEKQLGKEISSLPWPKEDTSP